MNLATSSHSKYGGWRWEAIKVGAGVFFFVNVLGRLTRNRTFISTMSPHPLLPIGTEQKANHFFSTILNVIPVNVEKINLNPMSRLKIETNHIAIRENPVKDNRTELSIKKNKEGLGKNPVKTWWRKRAGLMRRKAVGNEATDSPRVVKRRAEWDERPLATAGRPQFLN